MSARQVTGRDGKTYPARPAAPRERAAAIALAHRLRCGEHLSERAVQDRLAASGVRRSLGTVHTYLTAFTCPGCRAPQPQQLPERPPAQPRAAVINQSVW